MPFPERRTPLHVRSMPSIRGYPDGVDVAALGTSLGGRPFGGRSGT